MICVYRVHANVLSRVIFFFIDFFFCKVHVYLFLGSASWILKVSLSFS